MGKVRYLITDLVIARRICRNDTGEVCFRTDFVPGPSFSFCICQVPHCVLDHP